MARQKTTQTRTRSADNDNPRISRIAATAASGGAPPKEEEIRRRAHEIFLARNGAPGDPVDDWLQAERELRVASTPVRTMAKTTRS